MKIKQKEINRKTYAIFFGLLPLCLFILGFYFGVTSDIGIFGFLYYTPLWINLAISWFFTTETKTSVADKIPEKVKMGLFIAMLILILGVAPLLGVISIVNFEINGFNVSYILEKDIALLFFGGLLIVCSGIMWAIVLHALDVFDSIRFHFFRWILPIMSIILGLFLFWKWIQTDELIFLIMGFFAYLLTISVAKSRICYH